MRRHPLGAYLLLAVALSWSWWIPVAVAGGTASHLPGLVGPALAGVVVTGLVGGRTALRDLAARAVRWRLPLRWYALASAPLLTGALGLALLAATGGDLPSREQLQTFPGLPRVGWLGLFTVLLIVSGFGEEVGWRGVAWPLLRERHTLAGAAGLLAVPWAIWHLPTFWISSGLADLGPLVVPGWLLGLAAGAVVLGWLSERSGGSLLVLALFHASLNMASATAGTAGLPAAATSAAIIALAMVILRRDSASRSRLRPRGSGGP